MLAPLLVLVATAPAETLFQLRGGRSSEGRAFLSNSKCVDFVFHLVWFLCALNLLKPKGNSVFHPQFPHLTPCTGVWTAGLGPLSHHLFFHAPKKISMCLRQYCYTHFLFRVLTPLWPIWHFIVFNFFQYICMAIYKLF